MEDMGHQPGPDARAMLDALLEHAPLGVALLDADLRFIRVNPALAAMNGLAPEAHVGRTLADVNPDVAAAVIPLHRRALGGEVIRELPLSGTALGEARDWVTSYFPVRDGSGTVVGVCAMVSDVPERMAAERALRASEERLRQMAEHLPLVFWLTSPDSSQYWYVSPAYERVWGRTPESLVADPSSFLDAVHPEDRPRVDAAGGRPPAGRHDGADPVVPPGGRRARGGGEGLPSLRP